MSDIFNCPAGKRNTWYYFGTLLVLPTFLGIFIGPDFLETTEAKTIWYCTLPAIFNVGWASVQIAHMAIVNELTYAQKRRDRMINQRNAFTYIAGCIVLIFAFILFVTIDSAMLQFRIMCIFYLSLGSIASLFYVCQIKEKTLTREATERQREYERLIGMV